MFCSACVLQWHCYSYIYRYSFGNKVKRLSPNEQTAVFGNNKMKVNNSRTPKCPLKYDSFYSFRSSCGSNAHNDILYVCSCKTSPQRPLIKNTNYFIRRPPGEILESFPFLMTLEMIYSISVSCDNTAKTHSDIATKTSL